MGGVLWNIGAFVVALGLLVAVHEFGHFWVARRCGVKVERFSIGFGKAIWRRMGKDGTEYVLALIPLGGYVKMAGSTNSNPVTSSMPSTTRVSGREWRLSPRVPWPTSSLPCLPSG